MGRTTDRNYFLYEIFVIVQLKAKWPLVGLATRVTLNVQAHGPRSRKN
jgi:hypothetical protein